MNGSCGQLAEMKLATVKSRSLNRPPDARSIVESQAEELLWIAEVLVGNRQAAESCVKEAIVLAEGARDLGEEWVLPWAKRLLVHFALRCIGSEIRPLLRPDQIPMEETIGKRGTSASERQKIRCLPPHWITASCDVLERACFILSGYLQYAPVDCALLLGCPRTWIEPICGRVQARIINMTAQDDSGIQQVEPFISPFTIKSKRDCFLFVGPEESADLMREALPRCRSHLSISTSRDLSTIALQGAGQFQVVASDVLRSSGLLLWCIVLALAVPVFCTLLGL